MSFPIRKILCPVDLGANAGQALAFAAELAMRSDAFVYALHVVPLVAPIAPVPIDLDTYAPMQEAARQKLDELAKSFLEGVRRELIVAIGEPVSTILRFEASLEPDLVVMATRGRKGFSRVLLGSVTESVLRDSRCPVVTVRSRYPEHHFVGRWMTADPKTARPQEKLAALKERMREGRFRSLPVVENGELVGIVTDRDIREHAGDLDTTDAAGAMTTEVLTVTPQTSVWDAARLLSERKIGGMPVLDNEQLVGIITTSDLLRAFVAMQ